MTHKSPLTQVGPSRVGRTNETFFVATRLATPVEACNKTTTITLLAAVPGSRGFTTRAPPFLWSVSKPPPKLQVFGQGVDNYRGVLGHSGLSRNSWLNRSVRQTSNTTATVTTTMLPVSRLPSHHRYRAGLRFTCSARLKEPDRQPALWAGLPTRWILACWVRRSSLAVPIWSSHVRPTPSGCAGSPACGRSAIFLVSFLLG